VYINIMESRQAVRMASSVGSRLPAYCTSVGKVLLAHQSADVVRRVIERGLVAYTPNTIENAKKLNDELLLVRQKGYAIDDEEIELGLRCVAAPIRNHDGVVVAAVGVAAPLQRMNKKVMLTSVTTVTAAADAISRRLGHMSARMRLHRVD
jgi:DNA-binding IclR family transcriptional regulator